MMGFLSLFALNAPTHAKRYKKWRGRISILTSPKLPERAINPNFQTAQYEAKSSEKTGFMNRVKNGASILFWQRF